MSVRPRPLAQRSGKEKEREREKERKKERERERQKERKKESGGFSEITEPSAHRGLHGMPGRGMETWCVAAALSHTATSKSW